MQGLNYYLNKRKDFSNLSKSKVLQSISTGGSSVLFSFFGFHTLGMIWANIIGIISANLYNVIGKKMYNIFLINKNDIGDIKKVQ